MLIILNNHLKNYTNSTSDRIFIKLLSAMIIYTIFDLVCGLQENDYLILSYNMTCLSNVLFFYSSYFVSFLSFYYSENVLDEPWTHHDGIKLLVFIPIILLLIITPFTLKFHFFFYIDQTCNYIKGPLYPYMLFLAYSYIIAIAVKASINFNKKSYYSKKKQIIALSSFVLFPLVAGLIQSFFTGISIIAAGGTIAIIQVYINLQSTRITIDGLTQINNRTKLTQYLASILNKNDTGNTVLFMLDVDNFKNINDQYGHIVGDKCLIKVADILKMVCNKYQCFLARYGGDEFCIVCHTDKKGADKIVSDINAAFATYNSKKEFECPISLSIGYCELNNSINNIPDFIAQADKNLYIAKKAKKK